MPRERRNDPAFERWAQVTQACLELMRSTARARHPRASARQVEEHVRRALARQRAYKLACYQRNG